MERLPQAIKSRIPEALVGAAEALCKSLDNAHFRCGKVTEVFGYSLLHPGEKMDEVQEHKPALGQLKAIVGPLVTQSCDQYIRMATAPAYFQSMFEMYKAGLAVQVVRVFLDLLEIGTTHEDLLAKPPIQWAHDLALELVGIYEYRTKLWIRSVCDPPDFDVNLNWDDPDEPIIGKTWCAPLLIVMRPSRYMPFDETRQWERADRETTKKWLNSFAEFFMIHLKLHVDRLADEKTVALAKKSRPLAVPHKSLEGHQFDGSQSGIAEGRNQFYEQTGKSVAVFSWKELESRFREIQMKLGVREKVAAEFTRTEWESGSVEEEWRIRGNSVRRTEFERLATIAARKLGNAVTDGATNPWLDGVGEWMGRTGLDKDKTVAWCPIGSGEYEGRAYKTAHMNTERIAELSAMFCLELIARGTPEMLISHDSKFSESPGSRSTRASNARKVRKTSAELHRQRVIFGAIQAKLKGKKYCAALDERRLRLPNNWSEEGCPDTYSLAYKAPKWRKRLQDEKHRHQKIYDKISASERQAIIEGDNGTRRAR